MIARRTLSVACDWRHITARSAALARMAVLTASTSAMLGAQSPSDADGAPDPLRVLGMRVVASGSPRDTLGLLVSVVTRDGPADQAGITPGSRVLEINGVPVRVAAAEIGQRSAAESAVTRFVQAIRGTPSASDITLRVVGGGRTRTVAVAQRGRALLPVAAQGAPPPPPVAAPVDATSASAAPVTAAPPISPVAATQPPPATPATVPVVIAPTAAPRRDSVATPSPAAQTRRDSLMALEMELASVRHRLQKLYTADSISTQRDAARFVVAGLTLGRISGDLATFLGAVADSALLVQHASADWEPVHAGDVVLQIDGAAADVQRLRAAIEARRAVSLVLLRRHRTFTVSIAPTAATVP
jgi:PDZ domain